MQGQPQTLVWKDINKVNDPLTEIEAERFWACLMFLFIMPPKHRYKSGDKVGTGKWKFATYAQKVDDPYYVCQCRYDEFIASHSTCCEHHTNYFCYYHRNLMCKYLLALNQADYILRNTKGEDYEWIIKKIQNNSEQLDHFTKAVNYYQNIIKRLQAQRKQVNPTADDKIPWVAGFYWNCLSYEDKIKLPQMFRNPPKKGENAMCDFYEVYKKCKFGEANFYETWLKDEKGKQWWTSDTDSGFVRQKPQDYSILETKIMEGNGSIQQRVDNDDNIRDKIDRHGGYQAYSNLTNKQSQGVTTLSNLSDMELNYVLAGKGCQYIKTSNFQGVKQYTNFNQNLPHYQYAKALQFPYDQMCPQFDQFYRDGKFQGFLMGQQSSSKAHDVIHNNQQFILNDASFSITHPLFMLYHGLIEYMTEQYLRLVRKEDQKREAVASLNKFLCRQIGNDLSYGGDRNLQIYFSNFFNDYIQYHKMTQVKFGDYPCFEWFDNTLNEFRDPTNDTINIEDDVTHFARGTYKDLMIVKGQDGNQNVRCSDELRGFYQNQIADMNLPEELKDFPFNFTFDILIENQKQDKRLPDFLQKIINETLMARQKNAKKMCLRIDSWRPQQLVKDIQSSQVLLKTDRNIQSLAFPAKTKPILLKESRQKIEKSLMWNFQKAIKQNLGPSQLQKFKQFPDLTTSLFDQWRQIEQKTKKFEKNVRKFSSLYARVQYPSNLKTFIVSLMLKIKNIQQFQFRNTGEESISRLKNKIIKSQGKFKISPFSVFSKENLSEVCPRCLDKKTSTYNLFSDFEGPLYPVLIDLHLNSNYGVLYDSQGLAPIEKSFSELLETENNHPSGKFDFQVVSGAVQAKFNIIKCLDVYSRDKIEVDNKDVSYEFYLNAKSFDLISGQPFIWLKAKKYSLNTEIIFEELEAPRNPNTKANGKQLVYKQFRGQIIIQNGTKFEVKNFNFEIKNYFPEACYDIRIDANYNILVIDSNIQEKRKIFF